MDIREILDSNKLYSLIAVKGQMQNIEIRINPNGERYVLCDLKVVRPSISDDEYGSGYNRIHICIPADITTQLQLDEDKLKSYKNNEVYAELSITSRVNQNKSNNGEIFKFNNVRFYANYIELVKTVQKATTVAKPVSIAI